jgi:ribonuclease P protein component
VTERGSPNTLELTLPRERRIRARPDFVALQQGVRVHTPHFLLLVGRTPSTATRPVPAPSRLGITVTRKVGNSVRRNRIKRLVREAFRREPSLVPGGVDLVVIAKDGAAALGLADVQAEFSRARGMLQRRAGEILARPARP